MKLRFIEETLIDGAKRYSTESSEDGVVWTYIGGSLAYDKGIAYRLFEEYKRNIRVPSFIVIEEVTL